MEIHEDAAVGFSRAAGDYERFRPGYPPGAVEVLVERLDLRPGRSVLDLGAGTGKLTRLLVPSGARVVAVEPIDEMRAQLARAVPGVAALAGTAEAIPLETGAVDAVVVAQAFHWFDHARALPEIHRVLRPGGSLALVWNEWDTDGSPTLARLEAFVESRRPAAPGWSQDELFADHPLFGPLEEHAFPNPFALPHESLVARVATISFVAALPERDRTAFLDEVRALLAGEPEPLEAGYRTTVYLSRRSEAPL